MGCVAWQPCNNYFVGLVQIVLKREPSSPGGSLNESRSREEESLPESSASVAEKLEEPDTTEHVHSMMDDPEICSFVREKLNSLPILALSELTKARQVFLLTTHYSFVLKAIFYCTLAFSTAIFGIID